MIFEGGVNGDIFKVYIERLLVPSLKKDDIVLMDNLSSHKVKGIVDAIETAGVFVQFLPEYSPDLSPIKLMWSKVKSILRSLKARTFDELLPAVKTAFDAILLIFLVSSPIAVILFRLLQPIPLFNLIRYIRCVLKSEFYCSGIPFRIGLLYAGFKKNSYTYYLQLLIKLYSLLKMSEKRKLYIKRYEKTGGNSR